MRVFCMNQRTRELWRKAAHIVIGTFCLGAAVFIEQHHGWAALELTLACVLAVLVLADVLIADYGWKLPLYHHLQRPHETEGLHTATLSVLSAIVVIKLFSIPVAIAAIAMLIYGDSAAAIAGAYARSRKKVAAPRIAAMFIVSALIGVYALGWQVGVGMAIVATVAECWTKKIDDAVTIPILAGLAGQLLLHFL